MAKRFKTKTAATLASGRRKLAVIRENARELRARLAAERKPKGKS